MWNDLTILSPLHPRRSYEALPQLYNSEFRDELYHRHFLSPNRRLHDPKRQRIGHLDCAGREVYFAFEPKANTSADRLNDTAAHSEVKVSGNGKIDLSPCHICRRKPTVKSELDAFGDCECCGERTCYICTRKCEGPGVFWKASIRAIGNTDGDVMALEDAGSNGKYSGGVAHIPEDESDLVERPQDRKGLEHRDKICSGCCLERGAEGEVWCLGCLRVEG